MDTNVMAGAIELYYPDRSGRKVHIEDKDPAVEEYRFFAVMPLCFRHGKENRSVRVMDQAELASVYSMAIAKEFFRFIKIPVRIVHAEIPLVCGARNRLDI